MNENFLEICNQYDGDLSTILILDSGVPIQNEFQDNIIHSKNINFFQSPFIEKYCSGKSYIFKNKRYNFEYEDELDLYDHQTHLHSIISSKYLGISPKSNIICGKILNKHGKAPLELILEGLIYANFINPDIVNISNGYSIEEIGKSNEYDIHDKIHLEIMKLYKKNIIVIASKKNIDVGFYPADFKEVISIAEYKKNNFNYSDVIYDKVNFLVNTNYNSFNIKTGSSYMTAFISGVVSNYITHKKKKDHPIKIKEIKRVLKENIKNLPKIYTPTITLTEMSTDRINNIIKDFN